MPRFDDSVLVRIERRDADALAQLLRVVPLTRSALAREAMRIGLATLSRDPAAILRSPTPDPTL